MSTVQHFGLYQVRRKLQITTTINVTARVTDALMCRHLTIISVAKGGHWTQAPPRPKMDKPGKG